MIQFQTPGLPWSQGHVFIPEAFPWRGVVCRLTLASATRAWLFVWNVADCASAGINGVPPVWLVGQVILVYKGLHSHVLSSCVITRVWDRQACLYSMAQTLALSKLVKCLQRYRKRLIISLVWHENGYLHFLRCVSVKNRRKLKCFSIFEFAAIY